MHMVSSLSIHNPPLVRSIHHHHCFSPDLENSQEIQASVRSLRSFTLSPGPVLLSSQDQSDKPESDQHFNFPLIRVQPPEDDKELSGQLRTSGCHEALSRSNSPSATGLSGLSHTSLESDAFYRLMNKYVILLWMYAFMNDFQFIFFAVTLCLAATARPQAPPPRPSVAPGTEADIRQTQTGGGSLQSQWARNNLLPYVSAHLLDVSSQFVQLLVFIHRWQPNISLLSVLRSCPELDKDSSGHTSIVTGFSDTHQFPQISKLGFPNTMEKTSISRSAHTIKVLVNFNSLSTSIYNDHLLAQPGSKFKYGWDCVF